MENCKIRKKLYNIIYIFWVFLLSRSMVYILSFISYNAHLFNIKKLINIIIEKKEITKYLMKYKVEIFIFFILLLILFSGIKFINRGISSARNDQIEITEIKINSVDRQLSYIGTFILPLLASFQKIGIIWLIVYEFFILIITSKNIEDYYKMIYAFVFKEYTVTLKSGKEMVLFSNILKEISIVDLPKKINIKSINISNENLSEYIYVYCKIKRR